MGDVLYDALLADVPGAACRVYAPSSQPSRFARLSRPASAGKRCQLLVRFAAVPIRRSPIESILKRPQAWIGDAAHARHPHIPLRATCISRRGSTRPVSSSAIACAERVLDESNAARKDRRECRLSTRRAMAAAASGFRRGMRPRSGAAPTFSSALPSYWRRTRGGLIALMQTKAGKTLDDALSELREAVDYCRFYATERAGALSPQPMPGPTG